MHSSVREDRKAKFVKAAIESESRPERILTYERMLGHVGLLGRLNADCRILDLGCGTGRLAMYLAAKWSNTHGIDIDRTLIELAKEEARKHSAPCSFVVGRAEQLPYQDSFFDLCIAASVLEHVMDWRMTLVK